MEVKSMNSTMLAFVGDSYYDLKIRGMLCRDGINKPHRLHQLAIKYVSAHAQAATLKQLMDENFLTEEEQAVVKKGRNTKAKTIPKNTDVLTYMYSTAFEALIGYLYLDGQLERLDEVVAKSIALKGATHGN
ncbi:MAG: ribonuclease III [Turicibacter sp.]|nr:ribonuclease III [Turicibacter sp.]